MTGIERIAAERKRHNGKGFTAEHDAEHHPKDLLMAASCYADESLTRRFLWPWDDLWWKPSPDNRIRELEKAGALAEAARDRIAAEIDRLQAEEGEDVINIDLDALSWKAIKQAAAESNWIPQEYMMNDWVSDVCRFLKDRDERV